MLNVISLGGGVQSSTMFLMALAGELEPKPDYAIFADTKGEPRAVYRWLDYLESLCHNHFPILRVSKGDLAEDVRQAITHPDHRSLKSRVSTPPFYVRGDAERGARDDKRVGMLWRSCTRDYKVRPIEAAVRHLLGLPVRGRRPKEPVVSQWIGISTDEAIRMKPSRQKWIQNRWPLIEQRMTRGDCTAWLQRNGYPQPPKSACTFCPYRSNEQWRILRDEHPEDWTEAVEFDEFIRQGTGTLSGHNRMYVHRSGQPLATADLNDPDTADLFGNECEGMCGT